MRLQSSSPQRCFIHVCACNFSEGLDTVLVALIQLFCCCCYTYRLCGLPPFFGQSQFKIQLGFTGDTRGKEPACQCRRCGFNPWVGKVPWRRAWQPTPVFLPGESMDRGGWRAKSIGSPKSRARLRQLSTQLDVQLICITVDVSLVYTSTHFSRSRPVLSQLFNFFSIISGSGSLRFTGDHQRFLQAKLFLLLFLLQCPDQYTLSPLVICCEVLLQASSSLKILMSLLK